jgi:hypothetical protein
LIFDENCKKLGPWAFDSGICAQKKWNDTPYTLGPSFISVGQLMLGVSPVITTF